MMRPWGQRFQAQIIVTSSVINMNDAAVRTSLGELVASDPLREKQGRRVPLMNFDKPVSGYLDAVSVANCGLSL